MKGFELRVNLLDDAVFSERGASEGGHRGLDYIPGTALLGAAAARMYGGLERRDAFTVFHSGAVRFGNALPTASDGAAAYPVPLGWHHDKSESPLNGQHLQPERIWNLTRVEAIPGNRQPQQLRLGYVTPDGRMIRPATNLRMKTAIEPGSGRAREGALFGYEALPKGTTFVGTITVDDDVPEHLIEHLKESLTGRLHLGRSRSAEYGRADAEVVELPSPPKPRVEGQRLVLWLLSDLAATDETGQPTLQPRPEWLGLPPGRINWQRTFLRSRRYSPWNAKRGGPELERQVLTQGGVLVFDFDTPLTPDQAEEVRQRTLAGLGAYREAGLGRVWAEPTLLDTEQPEFQIKPETEKESDVPAPRPDSPLIDWLEGRQTARSDTQKAIQRARTLAAEYTGLLVSARNLKGLGETIPVGPSPSQWGSVAEKARAGAGNLADALFDERDGVCKRKAPGWGDEYMNTETRKIECFADWIRRVAGTNPDPKTVQHLAREVQDRLKQEVTK